MRTNVPGFIYILHFSRPLHHARHYVGWTEQEPAGRIKRHLAGDGAKLVRAVVAAGIQVTIAAVFAGTRDEERKFKRRKQTPDLCPLCRCAVANGRQK